MGEASSNILARRTKQFALRVIRLYEALPKRTTAQVLGTQSLRSGTLVCVQYREGMRARSTAEFISKIESASQELEETCYWMQLLIEAGIVSQAKLNALLDEAGEINAMLTASVRTAKRRRR
jgi:four helix bundle protein